MHKIKCEICQSFDITDTPIVIDCDDVEFTMLEMSQMSPPWSEDHAFITQRTLVCNSCQNTKVYKKFEKHG